MINPKAQIFSKISELEDDFSGLNVYQIRPEVIVNFPTIVFRIEDDRPEYTLTDGIQNQEITIRIDIWAETSIESGEILSALEQKMLEINYRLSTHFDVPEVDLSSHVTSQFIY